LTSTSRPWPFRFLLRVVVGAATIGALAGAMNWALEFSREVYARAYLITLLALGAAAGAALGALLLLAGRLIPERSRATLRIGRLEPSGPALSILRWIWISVVGAGLTALAAYLGSAPRFAPLLSREPRSAAVETSQPPNIILFSFDTVRPDHLGAYGYRRAISPVFDRLAASGAIFRRCIAASSWTIPSHAAILTGRAPSHIGAGLVARGSRGRISLPPEAMTLGEILRPAGYHTAAFIGGATMGSIFGFDQGFDIFNDRLPQFISAAHDRVFFARPIRRLLNIEPAQFLRPLDPPTTALSNYLYLEAQELPSDLQVSFMKGAKRFDNNAAEVNQKVSAWLDRRPPHPFFLFVHYFDAHDPYEPPPEFTPPGYDPSLGFILRNGIAERVLNGGAALTAAERENLIAAYDGEIASLDRRFGELLERLRAEGALENSIIAVVSDHGESFGEHGLIFHGHHLYDDLTHAVLILQGKGIAPGRIEDSTVSGVDVAPTLLDLAGVDLPGSMEGRSLRSSLEGKPAEAKPVFSEVFGHTMNELEWEAFAHTRFSVEMGGLKMIREPGASIQLFDMTKDPAEASDLSAARPEAVARLSAILDEYLRSSARPGPGGEDRMSDEALEKLRGLGYIQK